jgi:hypothetical protein
MQNKENAGIYWVLALIVLFPILAYWQVSFMVFTMKWDAMDQFFQHQFFICECIGIGQLPLWNPYQYFGSPFYADPQGGYWYPVSWLIGAIMPCDARIVNFSFILHVIIGGFGMYSLLRVLGIGSFIALFFALAYECNGVFVANAEHISHVVSAAWVPFVLASFFRLMQKPSFFVTLLLGGLAALLLTGGYPAYVIILGYFLVIAALIIIVRKLRAKEYKEAISLISYSSFTLIVSLVLSAGFIYSLVEVFPETVRSKPLTIAQILFGAYSPESLISSVLPYVVSAETGHYHSNISMINGYMGLLTVVFLLPGLVFGQVRYKAFFIVMAFISIAAAVGEALPVREWMAMYLPALDKFRFPSIFRLYWIVGAMVLAASGLQSFLVFIGSKQRTTLPLKVIWFLIIGILVVVGIVAWQGNHFAFPPLFNMREFPNYYQGLKFGQLALTQGVLVIALLLLLYWLFKQRRRPIPMLLLFWVVVELLISTQFNIPSCVVSHRKMHRYLAEEQKLPAGFPLPSERVLGSAYEIEASLWPTYYNLQTLHKEVRHSGFNPFQLEKALLFNESSCLDVVLANPLAFFETGSGKITWHNWKPGFASANVKTKSGGKLVLSQVNFLSWEAIVDGNEAQINPFCETMVAVDIPPGEHQVAFYFNKPTLRFLSWLGFGSFGLWAAIVLVGWWRQALP